MDVSIILVSYNTKDLTRDCLKSIYKETQGLVYDIWVVDNSSTDGSVEMIKEEFPEVRLIESKENLGFGRANNIAIKNSDAKYCFLLNTDTILLNNAVKFLYDFMEQDINQDVGACGGQLYNSDMTKQWSVGEFNTLEKLYHKSMGINFHEMKHRLKNFFRKNIAKSNMEECFVQHSPDYIIGADLMLRKSVLNEVGLFNTEFFMYAEEAELQFRIRNKGYRICLIPESKVLHYGGASSYNENKPLAVEKMILKGNILFFKLSYGYEAAKKAKFYYIIYYLRYLVLRFFSPKAFARLKMAVELKV